MIFAENIPMYVGMVLVFLAGYLIIFNVFQISVASEIAFYGQLKTLGATKRQIRRIIFGQGNRLSLIGIPLGLVLGYLLGHQLVPILIATQDFTPTVSVHPLIFVGSALFCLLDRYHLVPPSRPAGRKGLPSGSTAVHRCRPRLQKEGEKRAAGRLLGRHGLGQSVA